MYTQSLLNYSSDFGDVPSIACMCCLCRTDSQAIPNVYKKLDMLSLVMHTDNRSG